MQYCDYPTLMPCDKQAVIYSYGSVSNEAIISDAITLLEQHAAKTISIARLSSRYQLSERHFCRVFKKHTGFTPYQYYLQFRIRRAKELLRSSSFSLKEIAVRLRFENSCHFAKFFKKKTGLLPSQWRRNMSLR